MIALVVNRTDGETLLRTREEEQIALDARDAGAAIAAVTGLLARNGILFQKETRIGKSKADGTEGGRQ